MVSVVVPPLRTGEVSHAEHTHPLHSAAATHVSTHVPTHHSVHPKHELQKNKLSNKSFQDSCKNLE